MRQIMRELVRPLAVLGVGVVGLVLVDSGRAQQRGQQALAAFKGVTTNDTVVSRLYTIRSTGISTAPIRSAADAYLASLTPEQRQATVVPVDDQQWRRWNNVHRAARHGTGFKDMTEAQREKAFALLRASLSARGFQTTRDAMRLNGHLAELMNNFTEYGEYLYHITVFGTPSETAPWGWQLDGHHMIINYFVLRDQVVVTPMFLGAEPVIADSGKYAGTKILQEEERAGLTFMQTLTAAQRQKATIQAAKTANNAQSQAGRDNLVLPYAGIKASELNEAQRTALLNVVQQYVGNIRSGHDRIRMDEVRAHLDNTYFAWVGDVGPDAVFYYRVHSPVILIEFDHQTPVALQGPRVPGKKHIHAVVRTPNGNDYGKDLLRLHYEQTKGDPSHVHSGVVPGRTTRR